MLLRLENFRRFHKSGPAEIAPITVLLGENSSGKTSFAAGLRYILESFSYQAEGSFNNEPYFLGAFDQIAHYRGGKFGRAKNFSLSLRLDKAEMEALSKGSSIEFAHRQFLNFIDLKLLFENDKSQPTLVQVNLSNDQAALEMKRAELPSFRFKKNEESKWATLGPGEDISIKFHNPLSTNRNNLLPYFNAMQALTYSRRGPQSEVESTRVELVRRSSLSLMLFNESTVYASAPFRTKPERIYSPVEAKSSSEGAHIPILLAQTKAFYDDRWGEIKERLEKFGAQSEMFRQIDIKRLGHSPSDPFQIVITVSKDKSNIIDVGYGVSQVLPLLVELLINQNARVFIFQQPEVHLHPKAQAELGSYMLEYALETDKFLVLESHSDFMIDRIKADLLAKGLAVDKYLSVLFFERDDLTSKIIRLRHDDVGNIINPPQGYRSFFLRETARNLGID